MNQAAQSVSAQESTVKLKFGFIREDGMVFIQYQQNGTEYWTTPEKFAIQKQKKLDALNQRRASNPDKYRKLARDNRRANPERHKAYKEKYRSSNLERVREDDRVRALARRKNVPEIVKAINKASYEKNKEKRLAANKKWVKNNRDKLNATNRAKLKRYRETNPLFALSSRLRSRLLHVIAKMGISKKSSTASILGCDWPTLKSHIESQFTAKMSWDNRHLWEIDHVIPLGSAATEEEIIRLSHFSNLAPMWKLVNNAKGDLMPDEWAKISHLYADYIPEELA